MEQEIWKDIVIDGVDYTGLYQVSNLGRVRSLDRQVTSKGRPRNIKGRILSRCIDRGYYIVGLSKDGTDRKYMVHRLVAIAFIPNPDNLPEVSHLDESRDNCRWDNLVWSTHKDNCAMPLRCERISKNRSGIPHTQEWKDYMSVRNSGAGNPFYGKKGLSGAENPKARTVICEGVVYYTLNDCARAYGHKYGHGLSGYLKNPDKMPEIWKNRGLAYYNEEK